MNCDKSNHHRCSIRLKNYNYSDAGGYFVTICTKDNGRILGEIVDKKIQLNQFGEIVQECWHDLPNHYPHIKLDAFIIMPNHVHGVIIIAPEPVVGAIHELPLHASHHNSDVETIINRRRMLLPKIIGRFKMVSSKRINQIRRMPGFPFWQRNYYEHIIRNEDDLFQIRTYIENNLYDWEIDNENPSMQQEVCRVNS